MSENEGSFMNWCDKNIKDIEDRSEEDADRVLTECARRCSDSYSLNVYREAFSGDKELSAAMADLIKYFDASDFAIFPDRIDMMYMACGCPSYQKGLSHSKKLCRCSEKSLIYNLESIFGKDQVRITRKKTILDGDDQCLFEIRIKQYGHTV
jgi:predicted ArsR family transcriptional regulator